MYQRFFNIKQLLEAERKLIYITHLKAFIFKLDNVLLLKFMYIYMLSHELLDVV